MSPSRTAVALVFTSVGGDSYPWRYVVLAGQPLENRGEYKISEGLPAITDSGSVDNPARTRADVYEVSAGQIWFFDKSNRHFLSRWSASGGAGLLPDALWLTPGRSESWCSGELSTANPRRFLAYCNSATWWGLGKASVGHGHNRFVVYDSEGKTLFRKAVSPDSSVSLSPDGHLVAVSHGKSVDFYDLP